MSNRHLKLALNSTSPKNLQIAPELANIIEYLCQNGHVKGGTYIETKNLVSNCSDAKYSRIERLVDLGFAKKDSSGANTWIIQTRTGDYLGRGDLVPALDTEISRLKRHMNADEEIKKTVAGMLRVSPSRAANELDQGSVWERRGKLEDAVDAIDEYSGVTRGKYGKIIVRNPPNRYRASILAERLYRR